LSANEPAASTTSSSGSTTTASTTTTTTKAKVIKAETAFSTMSDADLSIRFGAVITGLTNNPSFPDLPVSLTTLGALGTSYTAAIQAALDGGTNAKAVCQKDRKAVITNLKLLAIYVQDNSNGDMAVFTSSGFQAQQPVSAKGQPSAVPAFRTLDYGTSSGQLTVTLKKAFNAGSYVIRYAPMTNGTPGAWTTVATLASGKKITISGLTPGTTYAFQAQSLGPTGYSDWSSTETIMCT